MFPASSTTMATTTSFAANPPWRNHLYKTVLCRFWSISGTCRNGENCPFAHGDHEIRSPPQRRTDESDDEEVQGDELSGLIEVGKIKYYDKDYLGIGGEGIVFKGTFGDRPVAVKRIQKGAKLEANVEREVNMLIESDSGDNVIRFFCLETDIFFHYLVLELCLASLQEHVMKAMVMSLSSVEILRQSTKGVAHLHSINIVHRDLNPQNVLFCIREEGTVRAVIADFGLCKKIQPDKSSLSTDSGMVGTPGWTAPEELNGEKTSYPMDIFSLGLIFYYALTEGSHPFGEQHHRNSNILKGEYTLNGLNTESHQLISRAISHLPSHRPTAKVILGHPFFWKAEKQLEFLCEAWDHMASEFVTSPLSNKLEKDAITIVTADWMDVICDPLKQYITVKMDERYGKYKGESVRHLLRLIRNMTHHYRDFPSVGDFPRGLLLYFTRRFPKLLLHVHIAMESCSDHSTFKSFYSDEVRIRMKAHMEAGAFYDPSNWEADKQLAFFCRVSDRLRKEEIKSPLSKRFLKNSREVVKVNWLEQISDALKDYLSTIGQYKGWSVPDLIRVIKNIHSHYDELPVDVRSSLGEIESVKYFTSRFPGLLLYVYEAMAWCSDEDIFKQYYSEEVRVSMRAIRAEKQEDIQ